MVSRRAGLWVGAPSVFGSVPVPFFGSVPVPFFGSVPIPFFGSVPFSSLGFVPPSRSPSAVMVSSASEPYSEPDMPEYATVLPTFESVSVSSERYEPKR